MQATDMLSEEHRVIERVLNSLERAARRLQEGQPVRPSFFLEAADFIKEFADGCHHRKEEGVLFEAMERAGVPRDGGPIGVMLIEHDQGRAHTRAMREAAQRLAVGDEAARDEVAGNALAYVALLRQHIPKEDNILYPMAEMAIPPARHAQLLDDFEHVEHEETGQGVHEKYLALAESLEREAAQFA